MRPAGVGLFVSPRIKPTLATACRLLPLNFGRQAAASPSSKSSGFVKANAGYRLVGLSVPIIMPECGFPNLVRECPRIRIGIPEVRVRIASLFQEDFKIPVGDRKPADREARDKQTLPRAFAGFIRPNPGRASRDGNPIEPVLFVIHGHGVSMGGRQRRQGNAPTMLLTNFFGPKMASASTSRSAEAVSATDSR